MEIKLDLIKKNMMLSYAKWICVIMFFVAIFLDSHHSSIYLKILIGVSLFLFFGLTFAFSIIIKRFKVIGLVRLDEKTIEITKENGESVLFLPDNKMRIYVRINGYRGESLQNMYVVISEGIGRIEIENNNEWFKFDIFVDKDFRKKLSVITESYRSLGAFVEFGKR